MRLTVWGDAADLASAANPTPLPNKQNADRTNKTKHEKPL